MKKKAFFSIRAKLTVTFLLVSLLPTLATLLLLSRQLESTFDKIAQPRLKSALNAIDADFEATKSTVLEQSQALARDRHLIEAVAEYEVRPADLSHETEWIGKTTRLDFVRIVDPFGMVLASSDAKTEFNDEMSDPLILKAFNGETRMSVGIDELDGRRRLSVKVYTPISYDGEVRAVLVGGAVIDRKRLRRLHSLSSADIMLFQGYTLLDSYPAGAGDSQTRIDKKFLGRIERGPGRTETVTAGGTEYMMGGLPIRVSDDEKPAGFFVLGVSKEQLNSMREKTSNDALYAALIGAGLSLVLATLFSIGMTRHISALAQSARLIGQGRFPEARNNVRSGDEIGMLAEAMNIMIAGLKDFSEKLAMSERVSAWREIARRIAHEIKNPLSPIQLSMENMKAAFTQNPEIFEQMFPECADTVLEEVDKLRRLANEFSEFARLPRPQFEKVDIAEVLENVVKLHSAADPRIKVTFTPADKEGLYIRADRDQMNRVFINLVKNAFEAMHDGGELKIILRHINDEIFVVFEDNGAGIEREEMQKIFTPYYTTKRSGSGLGLSIVHRIIQDHEASIDVYSEKGAGTKFIIAFKEFGDEQNRAGGDNG